MIASEQRKKDKLGRIGLKLVRVQSVLYLFDVFIIDDGTAVLLFLYEPASLCAPTPESRENRFSVGCGILADENKKH